MSQRLLLLFNKMKWPCNFGSLNMSIVWRLHCMCWTWQSLTVAIYAPPHTHTYTRMHAHTCTHKHTHMHTHAHAHTRICMHTHTHCRIPLADWSLHRSWDTCLAHLPVLLGAQAPGLDLPGKNKSASGRPHRHSGRGQTAGSPGGGKEGVWPKSTVEVWPKSTVGVWPKSTVHMGVGPRGIIMT